MTDCKHRRITSWVYADGEDMGEHVCLWSCSDCGHKFYPASDTVALQSKLDTISAALRKLRNEAAGTAGMPGMRELIGNSNLAYLELRIKEAEEALSDE